MCNIGDIILIDGYKHAGQDLSRHSFVVLGNNAGSIQGLDYSIVCNVLSSFKNDKQKAKKLSYPGNFEIKYDDTIISGGNNKEGFIKAEQVYYFDIEHLNYTVIGSMRPEAFERLITFIKNMKIPIERITDNLKSPPTS